mgnify:CR=1 FL=1
MIGIDPDGVLEDRHLALGQLLVVERDVRLAQFNERLGVLTRFEIDRRLEGIDGCTELTDLHVGTTEHHPAVGVIGIIRQLFDQAGNRLVHALLCSTTGRRQFRPALLVIETRRQSDHEYDRHRD